MKTPKPLILFTRSALIASLALIPTVASATTKAASTVNKERDFVWYCQSGEATAAQQHTVKVLFELADMDYDTEKCEDAFEALRYRSYVALPAAGISDLAPLSGFSRINFINAPGNKIASLKGLEGLPGLKKLWLPDNAFTSFPSLANFPKLNNLVLHSNPISSLESVTAYPALQTLRMNGTQIKDYSPLAKLNVSWLELGDTKHPEALATLPELPTVLVANLSGNGLIDFSRFKAFPKVGTIVARRNNIASLKGLESFDPIPTELDLADNMLVSVDSPKVLAKLGSIDFSLNPIEDFSFLAQLKDDILSLKLSGTAFDDWSLIARFMPTIYRLSLDDTPLAAITAKSDGEEWQNVHRMELRGIQVKSFAAFKNIAAPKLRRFEGPSLEGATTATCPIEGVPAAVGSYCESQIGR